MKCNKFLGSQMINFYLCKQGYLQFMIWKVKDDFKQEGIFAYS